MILFSRTEELVFGIRCVAPFYVRNIVELQAASSKLQADS